MTDTPYASPQPPEPSAPASTGEVAKRPSRVRRYLKRTLWIVGCLVLLVAVGLGIAVWQVDRLAKVAIELAGTRSLGVSTTLDDIKIGLFSGRTSLKGFQVANPGDFKSEYFIRLDRGSLDMSLANLLNDVVEIDQLTISGIHVNLVRETGKANFRTVIDNIREFESKDKPEDKEKEKSQKKFIIHEVVIRDVKVNVDLLPFGGKLTQLDVPLEELRLTEVGAERTRGENLAKVTATVIKALLTAVVAKGENLMPADLVSDLTKKLQELKPLETLQNIRENMRKRREDRINAIDPGTPRTPGPLQQRRDERRKRRDSQWRPREEVATQDDASPPEPPEPPPPGTGAADEQVTPPKPGVLQQWQDNRPKARGNMWQPRGEVVTEEEPAPPGLLPRAAAEPAGPPKPGLLQQWRDDRVKRRDSKRQSSPDEASQEEAAPPDPPRRPLLPFRRARP